MIWLIVNRTLYSNMRLYKFRSLQNLRRFLDIIVKKRLCMVHYSEMNDSMEGAFLRE